MWSFWCASSTTEEGVEGAAVQRPYSLADFELIRVIGRGSYAKVLMVELRRTRRVYAMKVIKKELVTDDEVIFHRTPPSSMPSSGRLPAGTVAHFSCGTRPSVMMISKSIVASSTSPTLRWWNLMNLEPSIGEEGLGPLTGFNELEGPSELMEPHWIWIGLN